MFYDLFIQKGEWRGILAFDIMLSITVGFYLLFNFVHSIQLSLLSIQVC